MKSAGLALLILIFAATAQAQRPRTTDPDAAKSDPAKVPPAPSTFKAKYEGGIIGYNHKLDGTLNFDDINNRLVFKNKEQKEVLSIPYEAISATYPDTQSRRPTAATVASSVPVPYGLNLPAWFIRKKYRYLILHFDDPDTHAAGVASFKIDNKELLASVITTLAGKSGLSARGDGYIRKH
jgi:hypothetical protein